jgi:hypothetical protein
MALHHLDTVLNKAHRAVTGRRREKMPVDGCGNPWWSLFPSYPALPFRYANANQAGRLK